MKVRTVLIAAALVAFSGAASADGICLCGMKRPLRADGLHHLKKPLVAQMVPIRKPLIVDPIVDEVKEKERLACNQNLCHVKRPLIVVV